MKNKQLTIFVSALLLCVFTLFADEDPSKQWFTLFKEGVKTMNKGLNIDDDLQKKEAVLKDAIVFFERSLKKYPNSLIAAKANYLIARCYINIPFGKTKNKKLAKDIYKNIIDYYPTSPYAEKAKEQIESIDKSKSTFK